MCLINDHINQHTQYVYYTLHNIGTCNKKSINHLKIIFFNLICTFIRA